MEPHIFSFAVCCKDPTGLNNYCFIQGVTLLFHPRCEMKREHHVNELVLDREVKGAETTVVIIKRDY